MLDRFSRSWDITKLSFNVIRQDAEMLLFPAIGSLFSLLYCLLLLWPTVFTHLMDPNESSFVWGTLQWVVVFLTYFGLAFIGTFFNTCVVYTAKTRFAGGDATFGESLSFAFSRIHLIFLWSLVAASVGVALRALDQAADRMGGIGGAVLGFVQGMLGMMWGVVTLFVVPAMVYEDVGPIEALKRSVEVLKRTWGESLIRHFGLGLIQLVVALPGVFLIVVGVASGFALWPLLLLGIIWVVVVSLVFNVATSVFNAALYEYATSGQVAAGFSPDAMQGAFVTGGRHS